MLSAGHRWHAGSKSSILTMLPFDCGMMRLSSRQSLTDIRVVLTLRRQKLYSEGGVLSVTSRILIVDLLSSLWRLSRNSM